MLIEKDRFSNNLSPSKEVITKVNLYTYSCYLRNRYLDNRIKMKPYKPYTTIIP